MNGNMIVSAIAILMALVLAIRGMRNSRGPPKRLLLIAGAWIIILMAVVLVIDSFGLARSS